MRAFLSEVKLHLAIINKMITAKKWNLQHYENNVKKTGALNFLGRIFKAITGYLDNSGWKILKLSMKLEMKNISWKIK